MKLNNISYSQIPLIRQLKQRNVPLITILIFPLLLFLLEFFAAPSSLAETNDRNTVFLPLKINTPVEATELAALSDQALTNILGTKGMKMVPRDEAQRELNYEAWPPTLKTVYPIAPAESNYIAAGSLTRLGNKISIDVVVYDLFDESSPTYYYKKADSISDLDQLTEQIVNDILAYTGRHFLIAKTEIAGNARTDSGAILRNIKSQTGERFDPLLLRTDLENIFKMGYFDDVRIEVNETDKGKEITFRVKEKAVIGQIIIEGEEELKEEDLKEVISVTSNTIINSKEVRTSIQNIRKLYKEKGFYNTEVSTKLSYPKPDQVTVKFVVEEGIKVYVKEIKFAGNTTFTDKKLRKIIETSEKGLFSWITESGRLKRDILEQDSARIGAFYHNNGYIEAKVGDPEIEHKGKWLYVTFNISEGEQYRVGTIDLAGDLIEDKNDLLGYVKLGREKYFSRKILRDDILRLTDRYAEKGYAFAEAKPSLHKNIDSKRMDIVIDMEKGNLVYVNRILIKGNTRTRDKVIRREMKIKEKGIFDASALRKSTEKLQRLEYFEEVNITPEPTPQEDLMDIIVDLKEKPTGTFSIGAGYSSVDNLMFMGEISQNNFLGKGQRLALQANLSSSNARYNLSFTEPHLNDTELLFGFDLYSWEREYDDYTKESSGFAFRFGYPLWEKWKSAFGYGYDYTDLTDIKPTASDLIKDSKDIRITSYVKMNFFRDTRNRRYDASKGSSHNVSVKYAGGPLGGDSSFTKIEGSTSWYFPLPWETTFHIKGAAGYVLENTKDKLPVYEKFYLGGLNTVRGFDNGKISPKDPVTGERVGGEKMWYANAEWIFPLVKDAGLKGLVFFDAGNVYDDSDSWDISDLKKSVGLGFRWLSPMGPLRLEWGYNIDPDPDEDQGMWDFSIGGTF